MTVLQARMKKLSAQVREDQEVPLHSARSPNQRQVVWQARRGHRSVTPITRMVICIRFTEIQPCLTRQEGNLLNKDNEP